MIFGSNASGKTNLFIALSFMKTLVYSSNLRPSSQPIEAEPFLLDALSAKEASFFEIVFFSDDCLYRYGFEVNPERVIKEWLYSKKCVSYAREIMVFERSDGGIGFDPRNPLPDAITSIMDKSLRQNALLVSFLDQFNILEAGKVMRFFRSITIDIGRAKQFIPLTNTLERGLVPLPWIENFIRIADLGIDGLELETIQVDASERIEDHDLLINNTIRNGSPRISSLHKFYDPASNETKTKHFDLAHHESAGTKRLIDLAARLYPVLKNGEILVIDEIDNSMHYFLTRIVIALFQSPETNPKNAQLIFTTHDVIHLNRNDFRRDEIWFVDKDFRNSSKLYSLAEFKVRKDASFDVDYLRGRYRAVPKLEFDDFARLLNGEESDE